MTEGGGAMTEGGGGSVLERIQGLVSGAGMDKTIVVTRDRLERHPLYGKFVRRTTKYYAHDEKNEAREGDRVEIVASRPLSKLKRWRLVRILVRGLADGARVPGESTEGTES